MEAMQMIEPKVWREQSTNISFIKIPSLNHEIFDDTMERGTFVAKALLS